MTRFDNLQRMLDPKSIALIGGNDAALAAAQCQQLFDGPVYAVNPRRDELGGVACLKSVDDLPQAPDAVFLAIPRPHVLQTVKKLADMGTGGIACFTAGYGELGSTGQRHEQELVEACGSMALVGPNCYGMINYSNGNILWPFGAGKQRCERGVALIMQSGMLPANLTMNSRSVPISFVISAGNQAALAIEDYLEVLLEDERVTAVGIYIEGIRNIENFSRVSLRALQLGKPVVLIKAGASETGSALAVSHTGSMAGADDCFNAFFEDHGIIRVKSPTVMMETLKFLSVSGLPRGNRIAAFTCSGGDAAMVADYCDDAGLDLPSPPNHQRLNELLPDIATISNPLDYTTALWGNTEVMPEVFDCVVSQDCDAAVIIQDFPPPHIHDDPTPYRNDALSFAAACNQNRLPAAVCSDLPENLDEETRTMLIERGITPLQGLDTGLDALALACRHGQRFADYPGQDAVQPYQRLGEGNIESTRTISEAEGKSLLKKSGIAVPKGELVCLDQATAAATRIGYPLVVKAMVEDLAHKTEAGGVKLGIADARELADTLKTMQQDVKHHTGKEVSHVLIEEMVSDSIAELLVGFRRDAQFGMIMVIASGGIFTELFKDSVTLLPAWTRQRIANAISKLKIWPLLSGYRGKPGADVNQLIDQLLTIARFCESQVDQLEELEINPLLVCECRVVAVDALLNAKRGTKDPL